MSQSNIYGVIYYLYLFVVITPRPTLIQNGSTCLSPVKQVCGAFSWSIFENFHRRFFVGFRSRLFPSLCAWRLILSWSPVPKMFSPAVPAKRGKTYCLVPEASSKKNAKETNCFLWRQCMSLDSCLVLVSDSIRWKVGNIHTEMGLVNFSMTLRYFLQIKATCFNVSTGIPRTIRFFYKFVPGPVILSIIVSISLSKLVIIEDLWNSVISH